MYKATEVPRGNKPIDPRADPKFYDYTWTNWWDFVDHEEKGDVFTDIEKINVFQVLGITGCPNKLKTRSFSENLKNERN